MSHGRIVNRAELAELCGVSLPTIDAWRRRGCPYVSAPSTAKEASPQMRQWKFDSAAVIQWLRQEARRPLW